VHLQARYHVRNIDRMILTGFRTMAWVADIAKPQAWKAKYQKEAAAGSAFVTARFAPLRMVGGTP